MGVDSLELGSCDFFWCGVLIGRAINSLIKTSRDDIFQYIGKTIVQITPTNRRVEVILSCEDKAFVVLKHAIKLTDQKGELCLESETHFVIAESAELIDTTFNGTISSWLVTCIFYVYGNIQVLPKN
jgi:hypothetical protein